jgi:hypothetical protein
MAAGKISLYEVMNRGGRPKGGFRARWRADGRQQIFNTGTRDRAEAMARATAESIRRRERRFPPNPSNGTPVADGSIRPPLVPGGLSADELYRLLQPIEPELVARDDVIAAAPNGVNGSSSSSAAVTPAAPSSSSAAVTPARPLGEAFGRALAAPSSSSLAPSSSSSAPPAPTEAELEQRRKTKALYKVVAKAGGYIVDGTLQRAVRFAGREPAEMDDDEEELIREGCEELCERFFGRTEIGPWGKIAAGAVVAGVGMYMGGKPLPKAAAPKRLEASVRAPERLPASIGDAIPPGLERELDGRRAEGRDEVA